jgi:hypothetical protein
MWHAQYVDPEVAHLAAVLAHGIAEGQHFLEDDAMAVNRSGADPLLSRAGSQAGAPSWRLLP